MAGKPKKVEDTAGMSKTARASALKKGGKKEGFVPAPGTGEGSLKRIISLGGGTHAYLLDPRDGKTLHLRVGSERWDQVMTELGETPYAEQITNEIISIWGDMNAG